MAAPAALRDFLDDWRLSKHWSIQRLADEVGVHQSLVSKWLHPDPRRRVIPSRPRLRRIAEVTGVPYTQLRELADLTNEDSAEDVNLAADAAVQSELDVRLARLSETLSRYPRAFWLAVVEASERLAEAGESLHGPVSDSADGGISAPGDAANGGTPGSNKPLAPGQHSHVPLPQLAPLGV
jgi:transcriptional regulator with XRE-family HTH domain